MMYVRVACTAMFVLLLFVGVCVMESRMFPPQNAAAMEVLPERFNSMNVDYRMLTPNDLTTERFLSSAIQNEAGNDVLTQTITETRTWVFDLTVNAEEITYEQHPVETETTF